TEERAAAAPCGERLGNTMSIDRGTTASFCRDLSRRLNRIVVDETGIQVEFAFHLQFGNSRNVVGPTVFKAVERQLGLKLTESKRPVEGGDYRERFEIAGTALTRFAHQHRGHVIRTASVFRRLDQLAAVVFQRRAAAVLENLLHLRGL